MQRHQIKRKTDVQIITEWIDQGQRVLDIGCGRGVLLEHLIRSRKVRALGVDTSLEKVQSCIKRRVPAYHGDADTCLDEFPEQFFDWILLSRMIQELSHPGELIRQSLKIGKNVAVGFVNQGYWVNRWSTLFTGSRPTNEVFPLTWDSGKPYNPVTIKGFQEFAEKNGFLIENAVFLKGDWKTPTTRFPNLFAGYAIFHLKSR
jgi:methionine biosynthesis protein MetW